jgi:hypothetical protein
VLGSAGSAEQGHAASLRTALLSTGAELRQRGAEITVIRPMLTRVPRPSLDRTKADSGSGRRKSEHF